MSDVFNTEIAPSETDLSKWVGDGKKYANPDDLAKAYTHADTFIGNLKNENEELRKELEKRLAAEELLAKARNTPVPPANPPPANQPNDVKPLSENDLVEKIRAVQREDQERKAATSNIETVAQRLADHYGDPDKANAAIKAKATELGVSVDFLKSVAAQSPKAFFNQFGLDQEAKPQPGARQEVNAAALAAQVKVSGASKPGTYEFYKTLRKENPSLYFSPTIQNQMHKDALEKGDAFYS